MRRADYPRDPSSAVPFGAPTEGSSMITDRPEFRAWLARRDAAAFAMQRFREPAKPRPDRCDCCGGPIGDTPSQVGDQCIVCLAERFGGDQVEEHMTKLLLGGLVKAAMRSDEIADDLVIKTVSDAVREYEHDQGVGWGRGSAGERLERESETMAQLERQIANAKGDREVGV